jgi:hypothetical protein
VLDGAEDADNANMSLERLAEGSSLSLQVIQQDEEIATLKLRVLELEMLNKTQQQVFESNLDVQVRLQAESGAAELQRCIAEHLEQQKEGLEHLRALERSQWQAEQGLEGMRTKLEEAQTETEDVRAELEEQRVRAEVEKRGAEDMK